jgi:hypothetical protein
MVRQLPLKGRRKHHHFAAPDKIILRFGGPNTLQEAEIIEQRHIPIADSPCRRTEVPSDKAAAQPLFAND